MTVMTQQVTRIHNDLLLDISKILTNVVCHSFGPRCKPTLLLSSTNQAVITCNGIQILKCLNIGHPVAQFVVQAVNSHHGCHGDGVKTVLLYLTEFFQQISDLTLGVFPISIFKSLSVFMSEVLPECLEEMVRNNCVSDVSNVDKKELGLYISSVIRTIILPSLPSSQTKFFTHIITETLVKNTFDLSDIKKQVGIYSDYFDLLHVKSVGAYNGSKIISGLLLPDFTYFSRDSPSDNAHFIILRNSFDKIVSNEANETVCISSPSHLETYYQHHVTTANQFLTRLVAQNVQLILCTQDVPQYVIALCLKYKINVISHLEEKEINFIELMSCVSSLSSVYDEIQDINIGKLLICQRIKHGRRYFSNINFMGTENLFSFLLCAPLKGLSLELALLAYKCFRTIHMAFKESSEFFVTLPCDLKKTKPICGERKMKDISAQKSTTTSPLFVIPGAVVFEFQLAKIIKTNTLDFKCSRFGIVGRILYEMLLSVPKNLHDTAWFGQKERHRRIKIFHDILSTNTIQGLNQHGQANQPTAPNCAIDLFHTKLANLYSTLQLIQQLLKLDFIIGTN